MKNVFDFDFAVNINAFAVVMRHSSNVREYKDFMAREKRMIRLLVPMAMYSWTVLSWS